MRISYLWLKEFIDFDSSPFDISEYLTDLGLEVESVKSFYPIKNKKENYFHGVIIGQVINIFKHPNDRKLNLIEIKISEKENIKIVSKNCLKKYQKIAVAPVGAELFFNKSIFKIKKLKIKGEDSFGILCSEVLLGIGNNNNIEIFNNSIPIGTCLKKYLNIQKDFIFEISLTPNRADAMSHFGIARDLNAALQYKKKIVKFFDPIYQKIIPLSTNLNNNFFIQIEDHNLCQRYSGVLLDNIIIQESPFWLKNRLRSIGLEPINNLVDISNYVTHHLGQPIHAFDANKIALRTIKIGKSILGKEFTTLDGVIRKLNGEELMIKDGNDTAICIAGIFGGKNSGITPQTTSVFLESAYFNPISIRKTSKFHSIKTDASVRFERGVDPNLTFTALQLAVKLLQETCKYSTLIFVNDLYPNPIFSKKILFRYYAIDKVLGYEINRNEIQRIISLLRIKILREFENKLELEVAPYRSDINQEIDIVEEILRIYGYNSIPLVKKIQFSNYINHIDDNSKFEKKLSNVLVVNGFYESINNSLITLENTLDNRVEILNPISKDLAMMRNQLTTNLLKNISYNLYRQQTSIKLFEFGKSYQEINKKLIETNLLSCIICGQSNDKNWVTPSEEVNFFELRGILEQLLNCIGINNYYEFFFSDEIYDQGIKFFKDNLLIVKLGILTKEICIKNGVKKSVFSADCYLDVMQKLTMNKIEFKKIPKFPISRRDLSLIIDDNITYHQIQNIAFNIEKKILKKMQLFDVYEGIEIPKNKKSYAISFYLQDENKTLTHEEIELCMKKIFNQLKQKIQATLRS